MSPTKMTLDAIFTIKIIILAIVAVLVITAWDEAIDNFIFERFNLDRNSSSSWAKVAILATITLFILLFFFKIEAHDVLGVGEAIDVRLTGQTERIVKGQVVHDTTYSH